MKKWIAHKLRHVDRMLFHPVAKKKIVGIGWAKTGTTSLGVALEQLGSRCADLRLDLLDECLAGETDGIRQFMRRYEAFEDWPWILIYREIDTWYPGSKFVLTERDPKRWVKSYRNMIVNEVEAGQNAEEHWERREKIFGFDVMASTDDQLIERYERHNTEVKQYFQDRPDSLLVVNWASGDGWKELCEFLGLSVPEVAFPHANRAVYV